MHKSRNARISTRKGKPMSEHYQSRSFVKRVSTLNYNARSVKRRQSAVPIFSKFLHAALRLWLSLSSALLLNILFTRNRGLDPSSSSSPPTAFPVIILAHAYNLKCYNVWGGPSEHNKISDCITQFLKTDFTILLPPIIPAFFGALLLLGFPIVIIGRVFGAFGSRRRRPGADCFCDGEEWDAVPSEVKTAVYPQSYLNCFKVCAVVMVVCAAVVAIALPVGITEAVKGWNYALDHSDADLIGWLASRKEEVMGLLLLPPAAASFAPQSQSQTATAAVLMSTNDTIAAFDDAMDAVRNVRRDVQSYSDRGFAPLCALTFVFAFIPLLLSSVTLAFALFGIRRVWLTVMAVVHFVFGILYAAIGVALLLLGMAALLLNGEISLQRRAMPGVLQLFVAPQCEANLNFTGLQEDIRLAMAATAAEGCDTLLNLLCDGGDGSVAAAAPQPTDTASTDAKPFFCPTLAQRVNEEGGGITGATAVCRGTSSFEGFVSTAFVKASRKDSVCVGGSNCSVLDCPTACQADAAVGGDTVLIADPSAPPPQTTSPSPSSSSFSSPLVVNRSSYALALLADTRRLQNAYGKAIRFADCNTLIDRATLPFAQIHSAAVGFIVAGGGASFAVMHIILGALLLFKGQKVFVRKKKAATQDDGEADGEVRGEGVSWGDETGGGKHGSNKNLATHRRDHKRPFEEASGLAAEERHRQHETKEARKARRKQEKAALQQQQQNAPPSAVAAPAPSVPSPRGGVAAPHQQQQQGTVAGGYYASQRRLANAGLSSYAYSNQDSVLRGEAAAAAPSLPLMTAVTASLPTRTSNTVAGGGGGEGGVSSQRRHALMAPIPTPPASPSDPQPPASFSPHPHGQRHQHQRQHDAGGGDYAYDNHESWRGEGNDHDPLPLNWNHSLRHIDSKLQRHGSGGGGNWGRREADDGASAAKAAMFSPREGASGVNAMIGTKTIVVVKTDRSREVPKHLPLLAHNKSVDGEEGARRGDDRSKEHLHRQPATAAVEMQPMPSSSPPRHHKSDSNTRSSGVREKTKNRKLDKKEGKSERSPDAAHQHRHNEALSSSPSNRHQRHHRSDEERHTHQHQHHSSPTLPPSFAAPPPRAPLPSQQQWHNTDASADQTRRRKASLYEGGADKDEEEVMNAVSSFRQSFRRRASSPFAPQASAAGLNGDDSGAREHFDPFSPLYAARREYGPSSSVAEEKARCVAERPATLQHQHSFSYRSAVSNNGSFPASPLNVARGGAGGSFGYRGQQNQNQHQSRGRNSIYFAPMNAEAGGNVANADDPPRNHHTDNLEASVSNHFGSNTMLRTFRHSKANFRVDSNANTMNLVEDGSINFQNFSMDT